MNKFRIQIASVPDRENLVAEIWNENLMIAEINDERGELEIEIYPDQSEKLIFDCQEFIDVLERAKNRLLVMRPIDSEKS